MKYWFFILALLGVCKFVNAQAIITDEKIEVLFNSTLTMEDLETIQSKMAAQNIDLEYELLGFSKRGRLKNISFNVDFKDGSNGSASTGLRNLSRSSRMGFRKYYTNNAPYRFMVGRIEKD